MHEGTVSRALFRVPLYPLRCSYLSNASLFKHVERTSSNKCPFFHRLKTLLGLTRSMTNRDKRPHINIHRFVPEQSRLLNDSDNKNSMSCLCYEKEAYHYFRSTVRDMDIMGFVLDCHGEEICFWQEITGSFWQLWVTNTIIMQINCSQLYKNRVDIIIPVESAWHHVVVHKLPFPPEIYWTVQLQDKKWGRSSSLLKF